MANLKQFLFLILLFELGYSVVVLKRKHQNSSECLAGEYFDEDRLVCLHLCGAFDGKKCPVEAICSSHTDNHFDPSICLPQCPQPCIGDTYCHIERHQCLPCENLCDDRTACRINCNDFFSRLTTIVPDEEIDDSAVDAAGESATQSLEAISKPQSNYNNDNAAILAVAIIIPCIFIVAFAVVMLIFCKQLQKLWKQIQAPNNTETQAETSKALMKKDYEQNGPVNDQHKMLPAPNSLDTTDASLV